MSASLLKIARKRETRSGCENGTSREQQAAQRRTINAGRQNHTADDGAGASSGQPAHLLKTHIREDGQNYPEGEDYPPEDRQNRYAAPKIALCALAPLRHCVKKDQRKDAKTQSRKAKRFSCVTGCAMAHEELLLRKWSQFRCRSTDLFLCRPFRAGDLGTSTQGLRPGLCYYALSGLSISPMGEPRRGGAAKPRA